MKLPQHFSWQETIPVVAVCLLLLYASQAYYWTSDAQQVAEKIVKNHLPSTECKKMRTLDIGPRPQLGVLQAGCMFIVAQLSKDPRACLPLMPDPYGISCIGQVWGEASLSGDCYDENVPNGASMECIGIDGYVWIGSDCSEVQEGELRDECIGKQAVKKGDPALCTPIENPVLKSVCEVRIELQKKYPEIPELR